MKLAINASSLLQNPSLDQMSEHAAQAAADGFGRWWLAQTGLVDALTTFTAVAKDAPGLEFGTAVIPTYPRHPTMLASQALTAQAATAGRITLGIGLSHKPQVEGQWGMSFDKPIGHMRDYLDILLPLLDHGSVSHRGEAWTAVGVDAERPTDNAPPVMLAALGPQMLKLAGSRADGTILWMVGPKTVQEHIAPAINEAAEAADRTQPDIVCSLPVCVTDNPEPVAAFADEVLAIYGQLPSYRAMLDREGASTPSDVSLFGNEDQLAERIEGLKAAGVTEFSALEFGGPEDNARTREFLKSQL